MKAYWIKSPRWLSFVFKNRIWHFSSKEKTIYLTFDDGPTKVTTFVLDLLKQYNVKATFFCIGSNIDQHPLILERIISEKHSIGNHTQHHINGWKTSTGKYIEECMVVDRKLGYISDTSPKLFRPPYGKCTKAQRKLLRKAGYEIIMWSVLSADFDRKISKEKCLENVLNNTSNGAIIVFHDSERCAEKIRYVLPRVLRHFKDRGYQFKCVDPLMQ